MMGRGLRELVHLARIVGLTGKFVTEPGFGYVLVTVDLNLNPGCQRQPL